jgi:thiol:disulfide interchange protein DsbD
MTSTAQTSERSPDQPVNYAGNSLIKYLANGDLLLFSGSIWLFGLLLAFTPCVLPLIILITGFLGRSTEISHTRSILLSLTYVMTLSLTFAILGILAATFGIYLNTYFQNPWILATFSILLAFLAVSLLGFYKIRLPWVLQRFTAHHNKLQSNYHFFEVAIMGILATLIASPCLAAPLVGVLMYIGGSGNLVLGAIGLYRRDD